MNSLMRITGVKTHIVDTPIPEEHRVRSGAGYKLARQAAFVEITTDEGIAGYGPCSFGSASLDLSAVAGLCDNTFSQALVGEDPHRIERIWDKLYYGSIIRVHGYRSVGVAILSAIDIALWDIKGKALGAPVYQLLGGAFRDPVPCYSSSVYWDSPEGAARQARAFLDAGFKAFKVKVGLDVENDIASLHAIREEVGYEVDMLVDANQCYTRHLALRVGRELEQLNALLFEEPLPIDDVDGHAFLADKLDVRIATGENMYTRWDFVPFIEKKAVHVVQADASRCGGISEAKRIFDLAGSFHLHAIPHTFSDALTVAASLHLVAACSNAPMIEYDYTYNPIQTALVKNPPLPRESAIALPTEPGLGVAIDWDFVADHPYTGMIGIGAGSRPAFGLGSELIEDRTAKSLA
jgi:D-galactarolactone cycloisomerase